MQVDINEIERALLNLLQELRNQKGDVIEIEPVDYYWYYGIKQVGIFTNQLPPAIPTALETTAPSELTFDAFENLKYEKSSLSDPATGGNFLYGVQAGYSFKIC